MNHDPVYAARVDPTDVFSGYHAQLRYLEGAQSVLDVGCGAGAFGRRLKERGCRVVGIESTPAAAARARARYDAVEVGDLESAEVRALVQEQFEAVLLADVLEHLRDPAAVLRHARQHWLAPSGRLVVSVPNGGHWIVRREVLRGRFPYRERGLFDATHLRFFTARSLGTLLAASGFRIEDLTAVPNPNNAGELTFASLAFLYRRRPFGRWLIALDRRLACLRPTLFAYQFVLLARPA